MVIGYDFCMHGFDMGLHIKICPVSFSICILDLGCVKTHVKGDSPKWLGLELDHVKCKIIIRVI